jgi:hypothetical protein
MLEANKNNSKIIPKSSSIKLTKAYGFVISSLKFKHIIIVDYNASKNNQWLLDWFKTHEVGIRDKKSIIILKMCQVKKGGTLPLILTIFCLL